MKLSTIQQVMTRLGIGSKDWDVVLVGDGSGQNWEMGCGWSCVLIDHYSAQRKLFFGGMSCGTIGLAELFPYFHAMLWYSRGPGRKRLKTLQGRHGIAKLLNVHIITDSAVTANQGNGQARRNTNCELWTAMNQFHRMGYNFKWHWLERDTIGLNALTDHISRESRKNLENVQLPEGASIYDFNPDDSPDDPEDSEE